MSQRRRFRFKIDAYSPETMPMARLAEYMSDLSKMMGSQENVHFVAIEPGSFEIVEDVEFEAIPKVTARLEGIRSRTSPEEAIKAYASMDRRLADDNATGALYIAGTTAVLIAFPGRDRTVEGNYGPVTQAGSVDGILIRVGGKDDTVPVYLEERGMIHRCNANRAMARRLAPHLYAQPLRVFGKGRWNRDDFGNWVMEWFTIQDFTILEESTIGEATVRLRAIPGGISSYEDPIKELRKLRGTDETE